MDPYPQRFPTSPRGAWTRRPDLDGPGIAYEFQPGGALGKATGRLSASVPKARFAEALAWLAEKGFQTRILHEGPSVALVIEAEDTLRPLKMFQEISLAAGLESAQPEI